MSESIEYFCAKCKKEVKFDKLPIQCDIYFHWFHGKCEKLSKKEWTLLGQSNLTWNCDACTKGIFPFNDLDDDQIVEYILDLTNGSKELYDKCMFIEKNVRNFNNPNQSEMYEYVESSKYITHEELGTMSQGVKESLSMIHFNCRSIKRNFDDIECLLHRYKVDF